MGDITKNFSFYEYRPKGQPKSWKPSSLYQKTLITNLAENQQVIRNELPSGAYMKITSGVRTLADYDRLINAGYNPSKTSDHNCGVSIPLKPDVVSPGMSIWDLFKLSFRLTKEGMCDFGQIIYEKNPANGSEWIHYGNSLKSLFSEQIVEMIGRQKFMQSLDGGRTYSIVNSI